jgi:hypothetical protein
MGDLILLEILQGIRNDCDYKKTKQALETLEFFELFGKRMVIDCTENFRVLRKKGLTIRKTLVELLPLFVLEIKFYFCTQIAILFHSQNILSCLLSLYKKHPIKGA